jgi:hypothetical protein
MTTSSMSADAQRKRSRKAIHRPFDLLQKKDIACSQE